MPKIVRFHETGGAEVLKLEDLPLAEPGEGEVRLKVEAIGLNRADVMFRQGQYLQNPKLPSSSTALVKLKCRPAASNARRALRGGRRRSMGCQLSFSNSICTNTRLS